MSEHEEPKTTEQETEQTNPNEELDQSLSDSSDYSSEDKEAKKEDYNDFMKTSRVGLQSNDNSSDSESDIEGGENDQLTTSTIITDNFVVNENNEPIVYKAVTEAVAPNSVNFGDEDVRNARKLFSEKVQQKPRPMPKLPEYDESQRADITDEQFKDFERDCDRGIIDEYISDEEISEEAYWIADKRFSGRYPGEDEINAIDRILDELHRKGHTPQYIINYAKNLYNNSSISDEDVYTIQKGIKEFKNIKEKRDKLKPLIQILDDPNQTYINPDAVSKMRDFIKSGEEFDLDNAYQYYLYDISPETTSYTIIYKRNKKLFDNFLAQFLYKPDDFALKLSQPDNTISDPPEPQVSDVESSMKQHEIFLKNFHDHEYTDYFTDNHIQVPTFEDMEEQLKDFAAETYAKNPLIIAEVRNHFGSIVINTTPTEKGMDHPMMYPMGKYGVVKRLLKKTVVSFNNTDRWLLIEEARKKGYLTCTIDTERGIDKDVETIVRKFCAQYSSDWDILRTDIIKKSVEKIIWPKIQEETQKELLRYAANYVCSEIERRLFSHLTSPPYTTRNGNPSNILSNTPIICLHYPEELRDKLYAVKVNERGHIEADIELSSSMFTSRIKFEWSEAEHVKKLPTTTTSQAKSIDSQLKFVEFMRENSAPVIAIAADNLRSTWLLNKVAELVQHVDDYHPRIIYAPCDAAKIYANSPDCSAQERQEKSKDGHYDTQFLVAASTARRMQNPLSELTRLVTVKRNHLIDWSMTPFQGRFIGQSDAIGPVHEAVERACMKAVALIGVDMTLLLTSHHHQAPLQFVPGLGPRIAAEIIKRAKNHTPKTRNDLIIDNHDPILPNYKIYEENTLPFLRLPVVQSDMQDDSSILDGTLIPPQYYGKTRDFVKRGILEKTTTIDIWEIYTNRKSQQEMNEAVERYINLANEENALLIHFIADQLMIGPFEKLRYPPVERDADLQPIREDKDPIRRFHEDRREILRTPDNYYRVISDKELFDAFASCSSEPIKENFITEVTIKIAKPTFVLAEHSSGIRAIAEGSGQIDAIMHREDAPERQDQLTETSQQCVIRHINTAILEIEISFLPEDLKHALDYTIISTEEPSFDVVGEQTARREIEQSSKNAMHQYARRGITNKDFRDITAPQAIAELSDKEIGAFIFRPSSKGNDHLSLTIKFPNNQYPHYDIVERKKRNPDAIGQELYIREQRFDDLEEIKWNFVKPIGRFLKEVVNSGKWIEDPEVCEEFIMDEKKKQPNLLVYRVTSSKYEGYLDLVWQAVPGRNVHEPLRISGDGIYYRDRAYQKIIDIFTFLKKVGYMRPPSQDAKPIKYRLTESEENAEKRNQANRKQAADQFGRDSYY